MAARWKVMRFECPRSGCTLAIEIADHNRRDPKTVRAGACHRHGAYEFVSQRPLYEQSAAIGEEIMLAAVHGHIERMAAGLVQVFTELDTSPDDVAYAIASLVDLRDDGSVELDRELYAAAMADGIVIGLRAAKIAAGDLT